MKPMNIADAQGLEALVPGDPLHVEINGRKGLVTNDAVFVGRLLKGNEVTGLVVKTGRRRVEIPLRKVRRVYKLPSHLCHSEPIKDGLQKELQLKLGRS